MEHSDIDIDIDMARLDQARNELAALWSAPTVEHADTYNSVHSLLSDALKTIDGL